MKDRILDHLAVPEMLDDDAFEERRRDAGIPDRIRVHDDDGARRANPEARSLTPLDPGRAKQQALALQKGRQQRIELTAAPVGRTESAGADEDVARIALHHGPLVHSRYLKRHHA